MQESSSSTERYVEHRCCPRDDEERITRREEHRQGHGDQHRDDQRDQCWDNRRDECQDDCGWGDIKSSDRPSQHRQ